MDIHLSTIIMTLINFVILILILKHFLWDKIKNVIEEREGYIEDQLIKVDDELEKARMYLLENERILKSAKDEGKKITERQKAKADKIYKEIVEEANKEAKLIEERARLEIEREKEKAQYQIKKQAVELAINLSYKALEDSITDNNQRELISDFITKVGN
ncbi:MAG: F0F1 ATP synthase subunit B [Clostridium sp.]